MILLCFSNLFANSAYSSIAPFYPAEAVRKGVPEYALGLVFSAYSISMAVFAPVFANLLFTRGSKNVLIMGCVCEGISMIIFGLFYYISDPVAYGVCSFLCRILEGFGNGCLNSSCKTISVLISHEISSLASKILMNIFPEKKLARMNGILQTFKGLGMLTGPIMGSIMFIIGGFQLPFYTVGVLLLALAVLNVLMLPSEEQQ